MRGDFGAVLAKNRQKPNLLDLPGAACEECPMTGTMLVWIATFAVAGVLGIGLYSLFRGGNFARSYSNRLMRLRVVLQAVAVLVAMGVLYFTQG